MPNVFKCIPSDFFIIYGTLKGLPVADPEFVKLKGAFSLGNNLSTIAKIKF